MKKLVIDVSTWQGKIDWEKVKPQIDGAILRCGYGSDIEKQDDKRFKYNADECTRLGIPFGVYLYSYADSVEKAKSEAAHVLRLIKPYKLSYPVYLDLEEYTKRKGAAERAVVFGDIIEAAGYWCGIYASLNWWNNYLASSELDRFTKWVAQYNTKCQYKKPYDMWQYSSNGKISGISGRVDMNECYRDFPAEINPVVQPKPTPEVKPKEPVITFKKGDKVKVKQGAKTYDGKKMLSFVYKRKHKVKSVNGNRVVITYCGIVVAAVHKDNLILL